MTELQTGNTYIIKGKTASNNTNAYKITIKEITQETLLILWEDSGNTVRELKSEFDYKYKVIEDLGNILEQQILKGLEKMLL